MFNLFGGSMAAKKKKTGKKKCPETKLTRAEEISEQYRQLGKCCSVIAAASGPSERNHYSMYSGGWKLNESEVKAAGIDIDEVYAHIQRLANKRRAELECELVKLEV